MALGLVASQGASAGKKIEPPASADPAAIEFLVASSAKDFKASDAGRPTAIRGARVGYFAESGKGVYLLCGSFKSGTGSQAQWTPFATIKTSDYEQWLGGSAKSYCEQRSIKWFPGDHSSALEQRLKE
jgi:hypothetical protein